MMERYQTNGELRNLSADYVSGNQILSLEINGDFRPAYNEFIGKPLTIEIKRYRKQRSNDANNLFHLMVGRIADVLGVSKPYCKNLLIARYGQQEFLENGQEAVIKTNIPPEVMMEMETPHCLPVKGDQDVTWYKVFRGSHTYNTKEMSVLIDGTIQEAEELGVETPTSKEMRSALEEWEKHYNEQL